MRIDARERVPRRKLRISEMNAPEYMDTLEHDRYVRRQPGIYTHGVTSDESWEIQTSIRKSIRLLQRNAKITSPISLSRLWDYVEQSYHCGASCFSSLKTDCSRSIVRRGRLAIVSYFLTIPGWAHFDNSRCVGPAAGIRIVFRYFY